ncbi:putative glucomannan 4-beta-mannosyltransferase [Helianthus annuus]|nr:putative glucomannan 4-beta-mannosyltransferase [Helianthus annuus]
MKMLRSPAPVIADDWCFRLSCQFVVYVLLLIGDSGVGRSCLLLRFAREINDQLMIETGTERPYSVGSSSTIPFECYKNWFNHVPRLKWKELNAHVWKGCLIILVISGDKIAEVCQPIAILGICFSFLFIVSIVYLFQDEADSDILEAAHEGAGWSHYFRQLQGAAGVWRLKAIEDVSGWKDRTTMEDMDHAVWASLNGSSRRLFPTGKVCSKICMGGSSSG